MIEKRSNGTLVLPLYLTNRPDTASHGIAVHEHVGMEHEHKQQDQHCKGKDNGTLAYRTSKASAEGMRQAQLG